MLDDMFEAGHELPNQSVYMVAQQVIKEYMERVHRDIDFVSEKLGTTKGYLYKQLDPKQTHRPLSIDRVMAITQLTGDKRILEEITKSFDLVVIPKKQSETDMSDLNLLVDIANMENNDVFAVIKKAMADGIIDAEEFERIMKEIDEAQKANADLKEGLMNLIKSSK